MNLGATKKPGIFREAASVELVRSFSSKIDVGDWDCLRFAAQDGDGDVVTDVLVACDLLKIWLRRLPEPITTFAAYAQCVAAGMRQDSRIARVCPYAFNCYWSHVLCGLFIF